ncbi:RNA-dependent RNA polymerase [Erysiphe necator associated narnavirus 14]|nr:RNA-dependent RNA polymerase [Erysiphe necator associated narnavirus 14]
MRERLASFPYVTVNGRARISVRGSPPASKSAVRASFVAGSRRSRGRVTSRRTVSPLHQLWKAVWCGLISCGLGTHAGSWEVRRWLSLSVERNGWLDTAQTLKVVCGWLRARALRSSGVGGPPVSHFPKRLASWLDKSLSTKGALAFSRVARALPCAPEEIQREAMSQHLNRLSSRHVTDPNVLADIECYVKDLMKGAFQDKLTYSVPSSSSAVVENGRAAGGYSSYVVGLKRQAWAQSGEGYMRGGRPAPGSGLRERSALASHFEDRLSKRIRKDAMNAHPIALSAERNQASSTAWLLRSAEGKRVVHQASVIAELGMKARIITKPPASVFAQGDLARQVIWPRMLERIPQILPYAPHTEEESLKSVWGGFTDGKVFLSADLTCATDGFGHDAIRSVIAGLRRAGAPPLLSQSIAESLGVGNDVHYVSYLLSDLKPSERDAVERRFGPAVGGRVEVPKVRGSLMGTPCSFIILSLLNCWMSERLGRHRIICGDDLAAVTHPENVSSYAQRATAVGSELHEGKSFRSKIGFVFCEAYALLSRSGGLQSFRPPSLKEFVRDGNGVMTQHSVDPSSFNRLARCAKTIYRTQRKIAMKKHRPAELPASLGGLGHPCKGRLRVPSWCRKALWELYLCESAEHGGSHDPCKYIRSLQVPAIPSNRDQWRKSRQMVEEFVSDKQIAIDNNQPGDDFIPHKFLDTYISTACNRIYLNTGNGSKKVRTQEIKPGNSKWPKPCVGTGSLSTRTRIVQVLEWDRRARLERGHYFPGDFSAHIRKRILAYRQWELPGDV